LALLSHFSSRNLREPRFLSNLKLERLDRLGSASDLVRRLAFTKGLLVLLGHHRTYHSSSHSYSHPYSYPLTQNPVMHLACRLEAGQKEKVHVYSTSWTQVSKQTKYIRNTREAPTRLRGCGGGTRCFLCVAGARCVRRILHLQQSRQTCT
jgi:hypothetical protein